MPSTTSTNAPNAVPTVTVVGNGSATARADRIVATITIERTAPELNEVERWLADDRKSVAAALDSVAVARECLRSHGVQVAPRHEWENDRFIFKGFRGFETIVVNVPFETGRSLELVRTLARALNHVRVGITYLVQDATAAKRRALEEAVADARQKAEIIAVASGGRLGRLRSLKDGFAGDDRQQLGSPLAGPAHHSGDEFTAVDQEITASVTGVWQIIDIP